MKSTTDIKRDMGTLYDMLFEGTIDIKVAGELANIAGKFLKADQLELARTMFMSRDTFADRRLEVEQHTAPQITLDS